MSDDSKYPSQLAERFQIRMPDGLRERIKIAAERNKRSMNAEIIDTLERQYPAPVTIEETAKEISETLELVKRFKGNAVLMMLADQMDHLLWQIANSKEGSEEDRNESLKHLNDHGKFTRFTSTFSDD